MNLVQSMIFISSMALWFHEDPAEYAANFLYKITDIANKARQPLQRFWLWMIPVIFILLHSSRLVWFDSDLKESSSHSEVNWAFFLGGNLWLQSSFTQIENCDYQHIYIYKCEIDAGRRKWNWRFQGRLKRFIRFRHKAPSVTNDWRASITTTTRNQTDEIEGKREVIET